MIWKLYEFSLVLFNMILYLQKKDKKLKIMNYFLQKQFQENYNLTICPNLQTNLISTNQQFTN